MDEITFKDIYDAGVAQLVMKGPTVVPPRAIFNHWVNRSVVESTESLLIVVRDQLQRVSLKRDVSGVELSLEVILSLYEDLFYDLVERMQEANQSLEDCIIVFIAERYRQEPDKVICSALSFYADRRLIKVVDELGEEGSVVER